MKVLLTALAILVLSSCAYAQPSSGKVYETRDAHTCASKVEPRTGAPSGDRLRDLVLCSRGGESIYDRDLYLLENVNVEIGKGRPYSHADEYLQDIDSSQLVYPIRGSFDKYQCTIINPKSNMKGYNHGDNCTIYPQPHAVGVCYRNTFGEWNCSMSDSTIGVGTSRPYNPGPR